MKENPKKNEIDFCAYTKINFEAINNRAIAFSEAIINNRELLLVVLLEYETFEVANDEIDRTLDFLLNLHENKQYFQVRVGETTSFLPKNQPLYAFTCFVAIPSLMSSQVHFRVPHSMQGFLEKILNLLNTSDIFPNINPSNLTRLAFLKERSAVKIDPITNEEIPKTDVVIFTGTSKHADQLRVVFGAKTLFITNGSGHNPIVVSRNAEIDRAVEATIKLTLYNQGQDCAAPNAILVHSGIYEDFMGELYNQFSKVCIGPYRDRKNTVGPISDVKNLATVQGLLIENKQWIDPTTQGIIRTAENIIEPTIICKPLKNGGNFNEAFAPLIFVQKYEEDKDLKNYFESSEYATNAMYVTLYGESDYVKKLIGREINNNILHHEDTFVHNTHLHAPGVERGVQPYGGYSSGASSVSFNGRIDAKPTLPQRDIFEYIIAPLIADGAIEARRLLLNGANITKTKTVEKLLRLSNKNFDNQQYDQRITESIYLDTSFLQKNSNRYIKLNENEIHRLLKFPNVNLISTLQKKDRDNLLSLLKLLRKKGTISEKDFKSSLYEIPKHETSTKESNSEKQLLFFKKIYCLLFGTDSGPRLASFLYQINNSDVEKLLDI